MKVGSSISICYVMPFIDAVVPAARSSFGRVGLVAIAFTSVCNFFWFKLKTVEMYDRYANIMYL